MRKMESIVVHIVVVCALLYICWRSLGAVGIVPSGITEINPMFATENVLIDNPSLHSHPQVSGIETILQIFRKNDFLGRLSSGYLTLHPHIHARGNTGRNEISFGEIVQDGIGIIEGWGRPIVEKFDLCCYLKTFGWSFTAAGKERQENYRLINFRHPSYLSLYPRPFVLLHYVQLSANHQELVNGNSCQDEGEPCDSLSSIGGNARRLVVLPSKTGQPT